MEREKVCGANGVMDCLRQALPPLKSTALFRQGLALRLAMSTPTPSHFYLPPVFNVQSPTPCPEPVLIIIQFQMSRIIFIFPVAICAHRMRSFC